MSTARWLWFLILIGLALRLLAAGLLQFQLDHRWHREFLILGDANGYWELGEKLSRGETFGIYEPPRYALRMPGFPALIAVSIRLFGDSKFAARLFLAAFCTSAVWLNFQLGRTLKDDRTGVIAAGLTAISPVFIAFSPVLLCESAFAVALLWTLWLGALSWQTMLQPQPDWRRMCLLSAGAGFTSALAIYLKPSWLLAVPAFAVLLVLCDPRRVRGAACGTLSVLFLVLTLLPWGIRNQQVTGHFVLTTLWMGPSLYDGLNPEATGDSDMTFFDQEHLSSQLSEFEVDQHYKRAAWEFAASHPHRVARLGGIKLLRYWSPWPNAEQFDHWTARIATSIFYVPCLGLALVGSWQERRNIRMLAIALGPILYFCALHTLFVASLRYRLPGEYPLLVLTAIGIQVLRERKQSPASEVSG